MALRASPEGEITKVPPVKPRSNRAMGEGASPPRLVLLLKRAPCPASLPVKSPCQR
eukprot:SAG31_NODE_1215_length_9335_cov_5.846470_3_plen_56_part_00